MFFGRTDAKAETPILWPPHAKSWLIGKDSDAGRDWGQEEKGTTEDEMAGWHHGLDGRESEWILGDGDGQGGLACLGSWGGKESDTTVQLNWTQLMQLYLNGIRQLAFSLNCIYILDFYWKKTEVFVIIVNGYIISLCWNLLTSSNKPCLPEMWETWVWTMGWEDPLEREMAAQL